MGNSNRTSRSSLATGNSSTVPRSGSLKSSIPIKLVPSQALAPHIVSESSDLECPICFSNYTALNTTKCCKQTICTGCYILIHSKPQNDHDRQCPFCSQSNINVLYDPATTSHRPSSTSISKPGDTPSNTQKTQKIMIEKKLLVPTASVDDRKSIEEQILKNQRIFREEITSSSSSFYPRSYERDYRSPFHRRVQPRVRGSSSGDANSLSTGEDAISNSRVSSSLSSAPHPNQSLADRLERLFLYYNGTQPEDGDDNPDDFDTDELIMSLSDIASASSRRSATTNDSNSRLRTTSDYEPRSLSQSQSSVTSSQRSFNEGPVDSIIESVFGGHGENLHTLEELEEMMILEAMRLSLAESVSDTHASSSNNESISSAQVSFANQPSTPSSVLSSVYHDLEFVSSSLESDSMEDSIPIRIPRSPSGRMSSSNLQAAAADDYHDDNISPRSSVDNPSTLQFNFDPLVDAHATERIYTHESIQPILHVHDDAEDVDDLNIDMDDINNTAASTEVHPRTVSAPPSPSRALLSRIDRVLSSAPGQAFDHQQDANSFDFPLFD